MSKQSTVRQAPQRKVPQTLKRGGFGIGMVVGLLVGLAMALGVALYITRAPVPFINKVPPRTAAQDNAETERNRNWDPNAPLASRAPVRPLAADSAVGAVGAASGASAPMPGLTTQPELAGLPPGTTALPPPPATQRDPAAILAGTDPVQPTGDPFIYFVQAGAFTRSEDAEQQRARLAIAGHQARISEREQAGRIVYRVRVGPLQTRDAADGLQVRLKDTGVEAQIVRVERP